MKDPRFGEPVIRQLLCPPPREAILLATPPKRAHPKALDVVAEHTKDRSICRDGMVGKIAVDDLPQPLALFRDRLVPASSQLLLDVFELGPQSIATGLFRRMTKLPKATATADQG